MLIENSQFVPRSREGITSDKMIHLAQVLFLGKTRKTLAYLDRFDHIDIEALQEHTNKKIKNIILDIDGCLAPAYGDILPEYVKFIDTLLEKKIQFGVLSNCKTMRRLNVLKARGIPVYEGHHPKPSRLAFIEACNQFGFDPNETLMVGDNPGTDGGAVDVLLGFILIKAIPDNKEFYKWYKHFVMPFQNISRYCGVWATTYKNNNIRYSSHFNK